MEKVMYAMGRVPDWSENLIENLTSSMLVVSLLLAIVKRRVLLTG